MLRRSSSICRAGRPASGSAAHSNGHTNSNGLAAAAASSLCHRSTRPPPCSPLPASPPQPPPAIGLHCNSCNRGRTGSSRRSAKRQTAAEAARAAQRRRSLWPLAPPQQSRPKRIRMSRTLLKCCTRTTVGTEVGGRTSRSDASSDAAEAATHSNTNWTASSLTRPMSTQSIVLLLCNQCQSCQHELSTGASIRGCRPRGSGSDDPRRLGHQSHQRRLRWPGLRRWRHSSAEQHGSHQGASTNGGISCARRRSQQRCNQLRHGHSTAPGTDSRRQ